MLESAINTYFDKLLITVGILLCALLFSTFFKKSIDAIFTGVNKKIIEERILAKTRTVRALLKNLIDLVLFFIAFLMILARWDVNIIPILTGAGILGLAISFGSQTLIKDLISGFFIITEDQFDIGDRIKVGTFEGEVYKLTLRLTILKDSKENLIYIPNSQITTVVRIKKVRHTVLPQ